MIKKDTLTKTDIHKKAMIEALTKSLGIVSAACKAVGIARQTHYEWLKEDEKYREGVEEVSENAIDFAESKLHQLISGISLPETKVFVVDNGLGGKEILTHEMVRKYAPDTVATIFYLKTKGKKRGYIEKTETDINIIKVGKDAEDEIYE